jgi:regulatory protein
LLRAGFGASEIAAVLDRLRQQRLVDDAAFAQYWLEQRQQFRPRGARLLQAELRQHGVDAELASATASRALENAADDAYRTGRKRAMQLAAAAVDERTFRNRLAQLLARRGFDWDTISATIDRLAAELRAP